MKQIRTYSTVTGAGLKAFDPEKYTISEKVDDPDAIIVHSTPLHDLVFNEKLLSICRVGAGFNTIPIERCTDAGICVFTTPGGNANAVKELTIAAMIMAARNVYDAMNWVKNLTDEEAAYGNTVEKGKARFRGPELMGKTLGIIGVGAIGSRMAKACSDLGMKVLGYDPYLPHARRVFLEPCCEFVDTLEQMLPRCDFITVHCPLDDTTKDLINTAEIDQMKDGVILVNYARGPICNDEAVCAALDSGKIKSYATDFPTPAQMKHSQVVCTPHLGAGTPEADEGCSIMAAKQTMDYVENGNIANSVNLPNVSFDRADGARVCVIHENKVGMLGKMTDIVMTNGLNIENLVNKGKGKVAYTIMDFNTPVPDTLDDALKGVDGVIRVRVID